MALKPKLHIIAGPNGSGKTTFTQDLLGHEWSANCIFINPDEIAQNTFGDWNSPEAVIKAAQLATEYRMNLLEEGKSMVLETVMSSEEKIDFIRKAKESGYFVRLYFIGTDDPKINANRIMSRYMNGGHTVPIEKILSRYFKSIALFTYAAKLVDRSYVYDNSKDGSSPAKLFRTKDGVIFKTYPALNYHPWAKEVITELSKI